MGAYLQDLGRDFVVGWNRFWFAALDPCALGAMRLLTGVLLLWYLATLLPGDLDRLLSDGGYSSTATLELLYPNRWGIRWMDSVKSPTEQFLWHGLALLVTLAMTIGIFSRVTTVLAWLFALAYFHRLFLSGSELEPVLALLLLYLAIAPTGTSLSLDAVIAGRGLLGDGAPSLTATLALRLFQLHFAAIYLMMALGKFEGGAWWSGSAIWWLLARPETRPVDLTPILGGGAFILVEFWTHFVLMYQLLFPICIANPRLRPLWSALGVPVWLSLGLATGQFELAAAFLIVQIAYVPGESLRAFLARRLPGTSPSAKLATT